MKFITAFASGFHLALRTFSAPCCSTAFSLGGPSASDLCALVTSSVRAPLSSAPLLRGCAPVLCVVPSLVHECWSEHCRASAGLNPPEFFRNSLFLTHILVVPQYMSSCNRTSYLLSVWGGSCLFTHCCFSSTEFGTWPIIGTQQIYIFLLNGRGIELMDLKNTSPPLSSMDMFIILSPESYLFLILVSPGVSRLISSEEKLC